MFTVVVVVVKTADRVVFARLLSVPSLAMGVPLSIIFFRITRTFPRVVVVVVLF